MHTSPEFTLIGGSHWQRRETPFERGLRQGYLPPAVELWKGRRRSACPTVAKRAKPATAKKTSNAKQLAAEKATTANVKALRAEIAACEKQLAQVERAADRRELLAATGEPTLQKQVAALAAGPKRGFKTKFADAGFKAFGKKTGAGN